MQQTVRGTGAVLVVLMIVGLATGCATVEEPTPEGEQAQEETVENSTQQEESAKESRVEEKETKTEQPTTEPKPQGEATQETAEPPTPTKPAAVRDYTALASQSFVLPDGPQKYDHGYTAERLRRLAVALTESASAWQLDPQRANRVQSIASSLRDAAEEIQKRRFDRHTPTVRSAFQAGAEGLGLFIEDGENLERLHSRVDAAANTLESQVLYLKQKSRAQAYFQRTGEFFKALYSR